MPKTSIIPEGSGKPLAPYVPGSMADGVVYVSGTLPFDKDNNVVHVGDPEAQTRHVLETIKGVVEAAGGTMDDVTFNMIMITDWDHYGAVNKVYAEYFAGEGNPNPARTTIEINALPTPIAVEVKVVATID